MPYISREDRSVINTGSIEVLVSDIKKVPSGKFKGALNYVVTRIALGVYGEGGYTELSDAIAALQDAADEIKRRKLGPYEDQAIRKNGDLPEYPQPKPRAHSSFFDGVELGPNGCAPDPSELDS